MPGRRPCPVLLRAATLTSGQLVGNDLLDAALNQLDGHSAYSRRQLGLYCAALKTSVYEGPPVESFQYSQTIVIVAGIALFAVGVGLGLLFGRRSSPAAQRLREAELKLDQVLQDKKAYEDEVVEHFTDTARLLNNLTEQYRDVHNHLAKGASTLCHGRGPVSLERLGDARDESEIPAHLADIRPPLDYAPKTSPEEKGMLNEEFGIDRKKPESPAEQPGPKAVPVSD